MLWQKFNCCIQNRELMSCAVIRIGGTRKNGYGIGWWRVAMLRERQVTVMMPMVRPSTANI
jgi:hypothetical protein